MADSTYVIKVFMPLREGGGSLATSSNYLYLYDPDARGGKGLVQCTRNPAQARKFKSQKAAVAEIWRVSTVKPVRADGLPNRPITQFDVAVLLLSHALRQS